MYYNKGTCSVPYGLKSLRCMYITRYIELYYGDCELQNFHESIPQFQNRIPENSRTSHSMRYAIPVMYHKFVLTSTDTTTNPCAYQCSLAVYMDVNIIIKYSTRQYCYQQNLVLNDNIEYWYCQELSIQVNI